MRYHYAKPDFYLSKYGRVHVCDHPVYFQCTLYQVGGLGLAVIQQRFDAKRKMTWWGEIDPWLTDTIYIHPGFLPLFEQRAGPGKDGIYPTLTIRQLMWALKMKPLKRHRWETVFDRRDI